MRLVLDGRPRVARRSLRDRARRPQRAGPGGSLGGFLHTGIPRRWPGSTAFRRAPSSSRRGCPIARHGEGLGGPLPGGRQSRRGLHPDT